MKLVTVLRVPEVQGFWATVEQGSSSPATGLVAVKSVKASVVVGAIGVNARFKVLTSTVPVAVGLPATRSFTTIAMDAILVASKPEIPAEARSAESILYFFVVLDERLFTRIVMVLPVLSVTSILREPVVDFKPKTIGVVALKVLVPKLMSAPPKRRKPVSEPLARLKAKLKAAALV